MKSNVNPADPGRRAVLKTIGMATAGLVAQPLAAGLRTSSGTAASAATFIGSRSNLRVAMLLPGTQGNQMSPAAVSFNDGFTLALEGSTGRRMITRMHDIGGGVNRAIAFARTQAQRRDSDVVVAMMSSRVAPWMQKDLETAGVPLMVANAGERIVRPDAVSPSFVYSSLELASAAYAAGRWAAANVGRRCAMASSYYESGFDMVPAFRAGFEAAGGTIILSMVTGAPNGTIGAEATAHELAGSDADLIAAFYTGADAREFFASYGSVGRAARRTVITSPMVTADEAFGVELTSVASWSPALTFEANRSFVASFADRFRRTPDQFAMLGYETARMIQTAAGSSRPMAEALRSAGYRGTRGTVVMDSRTNEISAPLYLRRITNGGEELLNELSPASAVAHIVDALPEQHGWITSYTTV